VHSRQPASATLQERVGHTQHATCAVQHPVTRRSTARQRRRL